jgi:TatD DNase family protein
MIDSHAHLHASQFDADRAKVIERMQTAGVAGAVTVGTDVATSQDAIKLATEYAFIWATVGVDPHEAASFTSDTLDELRRLAASPQVVAVGEIGLDYYWDKAPREHQADVFERQLDLARDLGLPVVIHNREAHSDTLEILTDWAAGHPWRGDRPLGVLHCFSGNTDVAFAAIDSGYLISLAGPVTFKNAGKPVAVAEAVPLEALVIETDAPYLTPHPHRGGRNEPAYLGLTLQRIAEIKDESPARVAEVTAANTRRLFALPEGVVPPVGGL